MLNAVKVLLILVFIALSIGCNEQTTKEPKETIVPVRLFKIADGDHNVERHFVGRIDAVSTVDLAFQVPGRLIKLPVQQGEIIKAGELLAALDPIDYELKEQEAEVKLRQATNEYNRGQQLRQQNHLSASAFDRLQANYDSAKVELEKARNNLDYTTINAPFDALITRRLVEAFTTVQSNQPILRVQDITELRVHINVPEQLMRLSSTKDDYLFMVKLDEQSSTLYPLAYREHSTEVDAITQTYRISFGMNRIDEVNLLPGMVVSVIIKPKHEVATPFFTIPLTALDTSIPGEFRVWCYDSQTQRVNPKKVEVSSLQNNFAIISHGLTVDKNIVSAGIYKLEPGQKVRPFDKF